MEYYKTTVPDRAGEGAKVLGPLWEAGVNLPAFNLTLFVGTVYSRFHYASDVVAGLAVGALAVWVTDKMDKNKF
ncbi:MAG: hypothetical protein RBG1_1C00001G0014 [candidate division Zixibacteria bacterium RBG-1]|nr:MAG: hypothetical protein RBG1_1C00001G0014 [candidate division Zixibacteria bacterium RBG-1]OGC83683.1 MAG: hypothetical protein A2V73_08630 [candidate division Zixibacteria bacterium RBG_19FT_COMBO_42_43]